MAATNTPIQNAATGTLYVNEAGVPWVRVKRDRVVDVPKPKTRPPISADRVPTLRDRKKLLVRKLSQKKDRSRQTA